MKDKLNKCLHPYVTDIELEALLDGSADSRYSKVKRLISQGKIIHIRRGLYCLPTVLAGSSIVKPHPFELAQHIYAPSYISLESALAYHNLIPEAVYTITSACARRSKEFNTPLGLFSYSHLPLENFYTEVEVINENGARFLMAKPWKAICDYIYCYKKNLVSLELLLEDLRINSDDLPILRDEEIEMLDEYYHQKRLSNFLQHIVRDLKL